MGLLRGLLLVWHVLLLIPQLSPDIFRLLLVFLTGVLRWNRSFRLYRRMILGDWFLLLLVSILLIPSGSSKLRSMMMVPLNATRHG
jgi:hypothetical protein